MMRLMRAAGAVAMILLGAATASADPVIFFVRHAERADTPAGQTAAPNMMANDPPLNDAGRQRAARLAALLASSGVKHIFTTEYQRTRQTAAPLAERLNVKPVMSAAKDPDPLVQQLTKLTDNALVVGHSNTIPELLKRLGVKQAITIAESEYGDVFVVVRHAQGEPTLIRLRY